MSGYQVLLNIVGGVALLLWAARLVHTGMMRAYGSELREMLGRHSQNRFSAAAMGMGVAAALQSSSATALLTATFARRRFITTVAGLALMLGADLGSTLVVQVLSFNVAWLPPSLLIVGVVLFLRSRVPARQNVGRALIGLALLLIALKLLTGASTVLQSSHLLALIIKSLANEPIIAVAVAAVITWLAHSSVAMVLLIISLTVAGVVTPLLGVYLVLGANIGSGIVPVVLTLSDHDVARQIPLGNLLFRVLGVFVLLPFVPELLPLMVQIPFLAGDTARQLANVHTLFNLALLLACLPFTGFMAKLVQKVYPEDAPVNENVALIKHLDYEALDKPGLALACASRESLRMADKVDQMLRRFMDVLQNNDAKLLRETRKQDDQIDALHEAIKLYLTEVSRNELDKPSSRRCIELIMFTTNLEHIGDIIDKNLLDVAEQKIQDELDFSKQGWHELIDMHEEVVAHMQLSVSVFVSGSLDMAKELIQKKKQFGKQERLGAQQHLQRLRGGHIESIETSSIHLDILRDLKRIISHLTSVAYPLVHGDTPRLVDSGHADEDLDSEKQAVASIRR